MTASIARKVIESFRHRHSAVKTDYELTTRETEILHSLIDGLSYKKLAEKYFISISTVRTHIGHIYEKLHVNSKSQAVAKALKK
jgi:DNA-binding NarL/FixJ family response regulator